MTGQVALEAMNDLRDDLITEAAELLGFLDEPAPLAAKPPREDRENFFFEFFGVFFILRKQTHYAHLRWI